MVVVLGFGVGWLVGWLLWLLLLWCVVDLSRMVVSSC